MLKLSTKGQYGVRAMFEVAKNYPDTTTTIREISEKQGVSVSYLEQILNQLRRAGLIESVKGPGGGYILTRPPGEVSILEVLQVLEGPVAITACMKPATGEGCGRADRCVTRLLWKSLGERIEDFLDTMSLEDLMNEEVNVLPPLGEQGEQ